MISDKTKEFIKEHAQTKGKTLYKIENGKAKAVFRWINSTLAEMACEMERNEAVNETKNEIMNKVYKLYELEMDRLNARIAKTTNLNLMLNVKSLVEEFKKYVEDNI